MTVRIASVLSEALTGCVRSPSGSNSSAGSNRQWCRLSFVLCERLCIVPVGSASAAIPRTITPTSTKLAAETAFFSFCHASSSTEIPAANRIIESGCTKAAATLSPASKIAASAGTFESAKLTSASKTPSTIPANQSPEPSVSASGSKMPFSVAQRPRRSFQAAPKPRRSGVFAMRTAASNTINNAGASHAAFLKCRTRAITTQVRTPAPSSGRIAEKFAAVWKITASARKTRRFVMNEKSSFFFSFS